LRRARPRGGERLARMAKGAVAPQASYGDPGVFGWAYSAVLFRGFDESALPAKAFMLAQRYDLNDRALCLENQLPEEQYVRFKYLFIGSQQQEVLIVPRMETAALVFHPF